MIRLRYMVKVPYGRRAALSRRGVFARDDYRCQYCGGVADSIDHVVPRSRGGRHEWENVAAACRPCNVHKRDRMLKDSGMRLRSDPSAPSGIVWSILAGGGVPDDWLTYLGEPSLVPVPAAAG